MLFVIDGSLDRLKFGILVRRDLQNKKLVGDTCSPTASMRTLKYFLADSDKHKARVYQLDFIGSFLQAKLKNRVFLKLDSRYADYFPEYSNYFGSALILFNSLYGMNNSGKLFSGELTEWLLEAGLIQYKCQMYIYYKYEKYVTKIVVLSYVYDFVYLHTYGTLGKWFVDTLVKRLHLKFLGYTHCFTSIIISHMRDHYISVDQVRYATSIVEKYLYIDTVKTSTNFYKTNFPSDMIFTKDYAYTSDEQV